MLSGGTLTTTTTSTEVSVGNEGSVGGLFSMSGGTVNLGGAFNIGLDFNANTAVGVVDISGGTLTHAALTAFMNTGNGATSGAATGILTVRGTGTVKDLSTQFLVTGTSSTATSPATGIVNLLTGGTIRPTKSQSRHSIAKATINFDGGTLEAYTTNAGASFLTGLDNAFVYGGGLTVDTNGQNVTIGQALTPPTGYGIGVDGSTIPVANGGLGYLAAPVVTFAAPASGVAATGVAVINSNGTVTGITITSPGSGYTSGQSVAVTFNTGSSADDALSRRPRPQPSRPAP